jgi:hypothetical protein
VAIDAAGNPGGSRVVQAKPINDGLRDSVLNLALQASYSGNTVISLRVNWSYPVGDPDLIGFQIFRALDSSAMYSYRFLPFPLPASPDYDDMTVTINGNLMHLRFTDLDVAFTEHPVTTFTYFVLPPVLRYQSKVEILV